MYFCHPIYFFARIISLHPSRAHHTVVNVMPYVDDFKYTAHKEATNTVVVEALNQSFPGDISRAGVLVTTAGGGQGGGGNPLQSRRLGSTPQIIPIAVCSVAETQVHERERERERRRMN